MRVCYFVQSHQNSAQIARLVRTLEASSPGALVLVGHDARTCRLTRYDLPSSPAVRLFHPPGRIERGRLSMVAPYLQAIDLLREEGDEYDWLVHLSGQDYPTQPLPASEAFLAASPHDGYLQVWEAFAPQTPWKRPRQGRNRYGFQYRRAPAGLAPLLRLLRALNGVQPYVHVHLVYGPLIGLRARRTPFAASRTCYAGKQWLTVRRAVAEFLADQVRRERELLAYYERCICPDESLFQTLLVNSGRFRLHDDDLRYADFAGSRDGRPRLLGVADFETIANPRYHFARKFDATRDERILDRLDGRIFAGTAG